MCTFTRFYQDRHNISINQHKRVKTGLAEQTTFVLHYWFQTCVSRNLANNSYFKHGFHSTSRRPIRKSDTSQELREAFKILVCQSQKWLSSLWNYRHITILMGQQFKSKCYHLPCYHLVTLQFIFPNKISWWEM